MKQSMHAYIFRVMYATLVLFTITNFFIPHTSHAAVGINAQIPFSGVLRDAAGDDINGTEDMVFKIYDAPTGGTLLWAGTHTAGNGNAVTVENGAFTVLLGSGTGNTLTLDFNDDTYYLGVTVGTDAEMTPRERLGASGYAINADMLDGQHASAFMQSNTPITIATTTSSELLTLDQEGSGNLLRLISSGTDVFSILNNGALNVMSADNSIFAGNIQFTDGSGVYLGSIDDAVGGLTLYMDTTDPALGSNVLMIGMHGDAVLNNSADITTPGSLSLNANSMNGPGFSLGADGNVTLTVGGDPSNTFKITSLAGVGDEMVYADDQGNLLRGPMLSDARLKENIETIDGALEKVLGLRGVQYGWKDTERFGSQTEIGFIAQEIQQVLPEVVRPNGEFLGVKIQNVVAVVVEAIKELNAKVADYFARTERLEAEVEDLRAEIELLKQGNTSSVDVSPMNSGSEPTSVIETTVEEVIPTDTTTTETTTETPTDAPTETVPSEVTL